MRKKPIGKVENNIETLEEVKLVDEHPSAIIAYDLALKAYEIAERRLQVVENRNEKILGYVSSLTLVVVAFLAGSNSPNLNLRSCVFITALIFGGLSLAAGLSVMLMGRIQMIDITAINDNDKGWLKLEETDFKKELIIKSSADYDKNLTTIERKSLATSISAILFVIEIFLLVIWLLKYF